MANRIICPASVLGCLFFTACALPPADEVKDPPHFTIIEASPISPAEQKAIDDALSAMGPR